jgi:hypothetical protein
VVGDDQTDYAYTELAAKLHAVALGRMDPAAPEVLAAAHRIAVLRRRLPEIPGAIASAGIPPSVGVPGELHDRLFRFRWREHVSLIERYATSNDDDLALGDGDPYVDTLLWEVKMLDDSGLVAGGQGGSVDPLEQRLETAYHDADGEKWRYISEPFSHGRPPFLLDAEKDGFSRGQVDRGWQSVKRRLVESGHCGTLTPLAQAFASGDPERIAREQKLLATAKAADFWLKKPLQKAG